MPKRSYNRILDEHLHILISQGNYEAYERLKKRYHWHALTLCRDILAQYCKTGISVNELVGVCDGSFLSTVKKYDPSLNSFFSFWKETTVHHIMEYLIYNSYGATPEGSRVLVSLDQEFDNKHSLSDTICETDDDHFKRRKIFEIKNVIAKNEDVFTDQERALLNLVLDGYSLAELEHSGVMRKSKLYLTFNAAVGKLQKLIKRTKGNKS